jgi:proteic killer suppression protein
LTYYAARNSVGVVIASFRDKDTQALFEEHPVRRFGAIERSARRKLLFVNQARRLEDLAALPGNRLEKLSGDRKGQHSIRINDQWRICFRWKAGDAYEVEIADYH